MSGSNQHEYVERRRLFMARPENLYCPIIRGARTTILHHTSGRDERKMDESTWLAVSSKGHKFIHQNPHIAIALGWLDESFAPAQTKNGHATAIVERGKLHVAVNVIGRRLFFGREEFRVTPVTGSGEAWLTQRALEFPNDAPTIKKQRNGGQTHSARS